MRLRVALLLLFITGAALAQPYYLLDSALKEGYGLYYEGKYDEAGKFFFQALKKAQKTKNKRVEAESYRLLGEVNRASTNRAYAIKYLDKAEAIFSEIQDEYGLASTKNRKAALYFEKGDSLKYIKYIASSLKISRDNGFKDIEYNTLTILGAMQYVKARDYSSAINTLNQALAIAQELGNEEDYPYVFTNISRAYQEMGILDSALKYSKAALEISEKRHIRASTAAACGRLSLIYAELGDYKTAFYYERLFNLHNDTITNVSREKQVAELVEKYEVEKQDAALQRQKLLLNYSIIVAVIFLAIIVVMAILFLNLKTQRRKLTEANEKMEFQNAALEENSILKDRLLSVLSHDLRSPVAALGSTLEIIRLGDVSAEDSKILLDELSVRVERTSQLLDNLLFWIKNQLNSITPQKEQIELSDLVKESLVLLDAAIQQKELRIQSEIPADFTLLADKEMIRLVLRNLISNAVKFSQKGGAICIGAGNDERASFLFVEDNGIGIDSTELSTIFQFKNSATFGTQKEIGMGIGLSLVRDFVKANNGQIEVSSQLNKGTKVQLFFSK